jgi:hypothetical protein
MKYKNIDGTNLITPSSYKEYKEGQIARNKKAISTTREGSWEQEGNVDLLSTWMKQNIGDITFGLCHGTRNGLEQKWFAKYLSCSVLGTEISPFCSDRDDTIIWDFHNVKEEWLQNVDFIYSNSFDHTYKPVECLNAWFSCLRNQSSVIILAYGIGHSLAQYEKFKVIGTASDLFHATEEGYKEVIQQSGGNVVDMLSIGSIKYFISRKND